MITPCAPDLAALTRALIARAHQYAVDSAHCTPACTFTLRVYDHERPARAFAHLGHNGQWGYVLHGHVVLAPTEESVALALRQAEGWMRELWHEGERVSRIA